MPERIKAGWRTWLLRGDILVSPVYKTEWPGPTLRAENWTCEGAVRGTAGIHACWKLDGNLAYARVVGKIIPTDGADVVVGEDGWRAEEVRVVLILLPKHTSRNVINALENRYQCDVRRTKYSDVLRQLLLAIGTERALYKAYFLTPRKGRQERFEILRKLLSIGTIDALEAVAQLAPPFSQEENEAICRLMAIGTPEALKCVIHNSWAGSPEKKEAQAKLAALKNHQMAFRQ